MQRVFFRIAYVPKKEGKKTSGERTEVKQILIEDQSWAIPIQQSQWYKSCAIQVTWAWINFIMFITTASSIYWLLVDRRFSVSKWKTFDVIFSIWPLVCKFSSVKLQELSEITFSLRRNASCLSYDSVSPHCTWLGLLSILQVSCLFYWHCSSSNPTSCEL